MAMHAPNMMRNIRGPPPSFQQGTGMLSSSHVPHYSANIPVRTVGPSTAPGQEFASEADSYNSKLQFEYRQELDAKRLRKSIYRKTVDYFSPVVKYLEERSVFVEPSNFRNILGDPAYYTEMLPCVAYPHNSSNAITTKFIRQATNKIKCPVFVVLWTPEGRRLVTGSSSGEFTLWNGLTFNFETILQAHDNAVRSMVWSRSDTWLVTGDASGYIKYWQANMNNVKSYQAHRDSIRGISFCPTDFKFATGSDDGTIRIWDFETCETLKVLRGGHGGEVKCVDWHPKKSLLVTGSRDNQQPVKLWDPRTADAIGTLYLHKGPVTDLKWNPINSNFLLSSSRDSLVKLFDLRTMKDFQTCRGHKREVMSVGWHPIYQSHFCSGGIDGSLMFWNIGTEREVGFVDNAHDGSIWSMSWHPQGHILCTGSNDCSVKFWTRNRPGDPMKDKYNAKARSETENPLDLKRSEIELEDEEDESMAEPNRADFDSQDISEFESNVPRPARPAEQLQQHQQFIQRPPRPGTQSYGGGDRNYNRGADDERFNETPRFPHHRQPPFHEAPTDLNQPPPFHDRRNDGQFPPYNRDPAQMHVRPPLPPQEQMWDQRQQQQHPPQPQPAVQNWEERQAGRPPVPPPAGNQEWQPAQPPPVQDYQHQRPNWEQHAPPPVPGRPQEVYWQEEQAEHGAGEPAREEAPRAALLPAPPQAPQPDFRANKRPWEQPPYDERYGAPVDNRVGGYEQRPPPQYPPRDMGDQREYRPRGAGGRGARRGGWRGGR